VAAAISVGGVGEAATAWRTVAPFGFGDRERRELAPALVEKPALGGGGIRRVRGGVARSTAARHAASVARPRARAS
jgi:hypothetical protein